MTILTSLLLILGPTFCPSDLRGAAPTTEPSTPVPSCTRVFLTQEEALELAFPGCQIERHSFLIDDRQQQRIEKLSKVKLPSRVVFAYAAHKQGKPVGTAWFDTHQVRSLKQTMMVVVDPDGQVQRIELLAFAEPREYIPRGSWYAQFVGRALNDQLQLKRAIRGVAGATLTARATIGAVRRCLALREVLLPEPKTVAGSNSR